MPGVPCPFPDSSCQLSRSCQAPTWCNHCIPVCPWPWQALREPKARTQSRSECYDATSAFGDPFLYWIPTILCFRVLPSGLCSRFLDVAERWMMEGRNLQNPSGIRDQLYCDVLNTIIRTRTHFPCVCLGSLETLLCILAYNKQYI